MTSSDLLVTGLKETQGLLRAAVSDFTDAELFARPCGHANSAAWQLGHLISEEAIIIQIAGATPTVMLPDRFAEVFARATANVDDVKKFEPFTEKAMLIKLFVAGRCRTIEWAQSLSAEQLDQSAPGVLSEWAATIGDVLLRQVTHTAMHAGQIQVLRRKLGKPVMF